MLTLYTGAGAVPLQIDDYYVKELASGLDELCFSISIWDDAYPLIQEESSIREESPDGAANYLVKAIDGGKSSANIKCQLDLDEWKTSIYVGYNSGSKTVGEVVADILPTGWTLSNQSGISYRRTIHMDAPTPLEILEMCRSTYSGITFRFDNIARVVTIVNMTTGQNLGAFATRDLNLKKNDYKGKSTGFATRLYAYGKNGLSFADINGGKPYVENHSYSDRVVCAYWSDERYTIAANLLIDAQTKLAAMAVPQRSFDCDVVDLAAADPEKYGFLSFPLFSVVSLVDQTRAAGKVEHRVTERWRYPYHPERNKVILSTSAPRIQQQLSQIIQTVTDPNSDYNQQQAAYVAALAEQLLGAKGGAVRLLDTDGDNIPDTLYIADDPDPNVAVHVWRFNYLGWGASTNGYNGPFVLGATFADGGTLYANILKVLNINADNIVAGTINADSINVTNINGANIKEKTIGSTPLAEGAVINNRLATDAVTTTKIKNGAVTGGTSGKIAGSTITTGNTVTGINTSLANADNYAAATVSGTSTYPQSFRAGTMITGTITISQGWVTVGGNYYQDKLVSGHHVLARD